MLRYFTIFACLLISNIGSASTVDSLLSISKDKSVHDTVRYKAFYDLSWEYMYVIPDSAEFYGNELLTRARKAKNKIWLSHGLSCVGISYLVRGLYNDAIPFLSENTKINKELGEKSHVAKSLSNLGLCYKNNGQYGKAMELYMESTKLKEELQDTIGVARNLGNIGNLYRTMGDNVKALETIYRADSVFQIAGEDYAHGLMLMNIGLIKKDEGDYEGSLAAYNECEKIYESIEHKSGLSNLYNNRGNLYRDMGRYPDAIAQMKTAIQLREELNDQGGLLAGYMNLGAIYNFSGRYAEARTSCEKALVIAEKTQNSQGLMACHDCLYKAYKELGNPSRSLFHYETSIAWKDSLTNEDKQREVIRLETQYAYDKQAMMDSISYAKELEIKDMEYEALSAKERANTAEKERLETQASKDAIVRWGMGIVIVLVIGFAVFAYRRFQLTKKQNILIESQKKEVEHQKDIVDEKNQEILDSINYAKRIQSAILPPQKLVREYLHESFILYKPKDIVAGDFYWMEPTKEGVLFAAADCTGHGVPGAMVSVVCNNGLNRSVREYGLTDPGKILDKTREIVISEFEKSEEEVKDGMDIALCALTFAQSEKQSVSGSNNSADLEAQDRPVSDSPALLQYAGAHNPLWIIRKTVSAETGDSFVLEEVKAEFSAATKLEQHGDYLFIEVKADKQPIGKFDEPQPYITHTIELNQGDTFYTFSDGYADQFGGEKGKKLKAKNFKNLLLSMQNEPMEKQKELIDEAFEKWKGTFEQLDDVCVIGVRV